MNKGITECRRRRFDWSRIVPVTDGHIRRRGLGDADAGSIPASGDELERGGETLSLIGVVADELQESGVAGREDDGKIGGNTAVAGGAAERSEDNGVTGCTNVVRTLASRVVPSRTVMTSYFATHLVAVSG